MRIREVKDSFLLLAVVRERVMRKRGTAGKVHDLE